MRRLERPHMLTIHTASHTDHALTEAHIDWIKAKFADRSGPFWCETLEMPEHLGDLPCSLYGPLTGDKPVAEETCTYHVRGEGDKQRAGASRILLGGAPRQTRIITVMGGAYDGFDNVLFSAYGGPQAPREPFDPSLAKDEAAKAASMAFWLEHALAL